MHCTELRVRQRTVKGTPLRDMRVRTGWARGGGKGEVQEVERMPEIDSWGIDRRG